MNKTAIIDIKPGTYMRNVIDAHIRNAVELSKLIGCDCLLDKSDYQNNVTYDNLIFNYASFYHDVKLYQKILDNNPNATIYWLTNEYNLSPNSVIKNRIEYVISNNHKQYKYPNIKGTYYFNVNLLLAKKANEITEKKYDCIYYGSYRDNREKYFTLYLQNDIYLSSSKKNFREYKHIGCNPKYIEKIKWTANKETLNNFKYSLYIEDAYSHKTYTHLANRFYESLFCNVVQFFDINCKSTIEKSGIVFNDYFYVSDYNELVQKIKETNQSYNWNNAMEFQSQWNIQALEQKEQMINELKKILGL